MIFNAFTGTSSLFSTLNKLELSSINLNGLKLGLPIIEKEKNLFKDSIGVTVSFSKKSHTDDELSKFSSLLNRDGNHIISPIIKTYSKIFNYIGKKNIITGYANVSNYMDSITTRRSIQPNKKSKNVLVLDSDTLEVEQNGQNISINGASWQTSKTKVPYVLVSSFPIKLGSSTFPYKIYKHGNISFYVSTISIEDPSYIEKMKGGVNLLSS